MDIPVAPQVPPETNRLADACLTLFKYVGNILTLVAMTINLWAHNQPLVAFVEEHVVMPESTFSFIINGLLAFTQIKSQSQIGFPFLTHPQLTRLCVTCFVMYGLASAAELVVYASGLGRTSVYATLARLGRIAFLCILFASMASLFYF